MEKPDNAKERGLVKGALRRVFSRSELRRQALDKHHISHVDATRPRVTKWAWCASCGVIEASYKMEVDHIEPVIPSNTTLENMTWDDVVNRIWCDISNLQCVCKDCHKAKTKAENKARRIKK